MNLPRWTAYVALAVIATLFVTAIPRRAKSMTPDAARRARAQEGRASLPEAKDRRIVVLGIDGMDPDLLRGVMERHPEGMSNFARLVNMGQGIRSLGTSTPPQSPVAWSNFITGRTPGGHGIFDFVHRDPKTYYGAAPTLRLEEGGAVHLPLSDIKIPTGGGSMPNRSGRAFWSILKDKGVAADLYRVPINFPVEASKGVSFPGMMTPALDSVYGTYTVFTTDPPRRTESDGGRFRLVTERKGAIRTVLNGPVNSLKEGDPVATAPLTVYLDKEAEAAVIEVGDDRVVMQPGQWSRFVSVNFEMLPLGAMSVPGIVRFYVRSVEPEFVMYASPINFDPRDPADTISEPSDAASEMADVIGPFFTQGMAEEVSGLKDGALTDAEFMAQANLVYDERVKMLDYALHRYRNNADGGLLFFYVSSVDLALHMMWRHGDPAHPFYDPAIAEQDSSWWSGRDGSTWQDVLDDLYLKMDPLLGRVLDQVDEDTLVIVMSDHGFAPYHRKFSLNTWLLENGYLALKEGKERELPLSDPSHAKVNIASAVDWSKTRAYGIGFNGLYLNLEGREAQGIVEPGTEADLLLKELKLRLEGVLDGGKRVVVSADLASTVYAGGERISEAPDVVVGYDVGFGNSDESSLGRIPHAILSDNAGGTFTGSHLMHPSVVSGILLTNGTIISETPTLEDLTVTLLRAYGVEPTAEMVGKPVLELQD